MHITKQDIQEIKNLYGKLKQKCVAAFWKSAGTDGAEIYEEIMLCGGDIMKEALRLYREDNEEVLAVQALKKIDRCRKKGAGTLSREEAGALINSAVKKAYYCDWKYSEDGEYLMPRAGGKIIPPECMVLNKSFERSGVICWREYYIDLCRCGSIADIFRKMLAMPDMPENLKTEMDKFFCEMTEEQSEVRIRLKNCLGC